MGKICISSSSEMAVKLVDLTQEQQCGEVTKSFHKPQPSTMPNHKKDPPKNPSETYWHWLFPQTDSARGT